MYFFFSLCVLLEIFTYPLPVLRIQFIGMSLLFFVLFNFSDITFSPSHLFTFFTDLTRPFSSRSHFLPFSLYPLMICSSFSSFKNKKNSLFCSLFPLRSTEISRKWKYSEKYNKTEQWKFLVIFPKRSTEISSLPNF